MGPFSPVVPIFCRKPFHGFDQPLAITSADQVAKRRRIVGVEASSALVQLTQTSVQNSDITLPEFRYESVLDLYPQTTTTTTTSSVALPRLREIVDPASPDDGKAEKETQTADVQVLPSLDKNISSREEKGIEHFLNGEYDKAICIFKEVSSESTQNSYVLVAWAYAAFQMSRHDEAWSVLIKVPENDPLFLEAVYLKSLISSYVCPERREFFKSMLTSDFPLVASPLIDQAFAPLKKHDYQTTALLLGQLPSKHYLPHVRDKLFTFRNLDNKKFTNSINTALSRCPPIGDEILQEIKKYLSR